MSDGGDAVRLERTFAADIDRVFRELIHQQLPTGADPRQYRQGWDAALASLTRYLSKERTDNADR
ncbi:MAG: hypothetical protein ACRDPL_18320 [Propionibacteriaceae bacterium]